jgi:hypothetical protein
MAKASLESLNELHDAVAKVLKENLDDPKVLANAIKFLKDNDITADLMNDDSSDSLGTAIKEHLKMPNRQQEKLSVDDMIALGA